MKEELIKLIKEEINYTEETNFCKDCQYYTSDPNPYVDGSWIPTCNAHDQLGDFTVDKRGHCDNFESNERGK